jgi:hypothetical protein
MQQIKGSVLISRMAFVENHGGEDAVAKVLAKLPPEDRTALRRPTLVRWYPFDLSRRLDAAIVEVIGGGKPEFFEKLGEESAARNLSTVHAHLLTPGDPHAFLAKTPHIYELYYEKGRREYRKLDARSGELTTHDAETFSGPDCLTIIGWHKKALSLCGATGVSMIEKQCRAAGAPVCQYVVSWK